MVWVWGRDYHNQRACVFIKPVWKQLFLSQLHLMTLQREKSLKLRCCIIVPIYRGTQQFAWPYRLKIYATAGGEVSARPCNELCHISMAQQRLWLSHVTSHSPQQPLRAPVNHQEVRTAPPSLAYSGFTASSGRLEVKQNSIYQASPDPQTSTLSGKDCGIIDVIISICVNHSSYHL